MCRLQQADYPPSPQVVGEARRWLVRLLSRWDLAELSDDAALLLTELVTNAVVHAHSQVHVAATVADGILEVGVTDHAPHSHLPGPPDAVPAQRTEVSVAGLRESGRGLALVDHIADAWGVSELGKGKQVWFRLSVGGSWAHRSDCPCADESLQRIRLDSGRFAVAVAGPWDQSPHDPALPPSR
jgi:anti-sigma regulatory factor (Ser/Thr protein kinase)